MACKVDLRQLVVAEAQRQGVDPGIALRVASTESGICQWRPDGSVIRGPAGEVGVFQLLPSTAAALGVDPFVLEQNIRGGVKYLRQLYGRFGSWQLALAAYNWGPENVASGRPVPAQVSRYVCSVVSCATLNNAALQMKAAKSATPSAGSAPSLPSAASVSPAKAGLALALLGGVFLAGLLITQS